MARTLEPLPVTALGIALDRGADVPLGVQLAWALRSRVRDGRLMAGQRLPGLRELADAVGVNMNTVRSVYHRLEQQGLLETRHGSGTFVATAIDRPLAVGAIVADAARQAHDLGADVREVAAALYMTGEPIAQPDDTARRQRLHSQIAVLEQAVIELQAKHPGLITEKAMSPASKGPRLLDISELEDLQAQLLRHLTSLQAAIDHATAGQTRPRATRETARAPRTPAKARAKQRPSTTGV